MSNREPRPDLRLRRIQTRALVDLARIRHASEAIVDGLLRAESLDDITSAQANALMVLIDARRPLTAAELARELGLSEVTVGRFVRALEVGGWIERRPDVEDARALRLTATAKTRAALPRFIRVSNTLLDRAFEGLSDEEVERVGGLLNRVRDRLDDYLEKSSSSGSSGTAS